MNFNGGNSADAAVKPVNVVSWQSIKNYQLYKNNFSGDNSDGYGGIYKLSNMTTPNSSYGGCSFNAASATVSGSKKDLGVSVYVASYATFKAVVKVPAHTEYKIKFSVAMNINGSVNDSGSAHAWVDLYAFGETDKSSSLTFGYMDHSTPTGYVTPSGVKQVHNSCASAPGGNSVSFPAEEAYSVTCTNNSDTELTKTFYFGCNLAVCPGVSYSYWFNSTATMSSEVKVTAIAPPTVDKTEEDFKTAGNVFNFSNYDKNRMEYTVSHTDPLNNVTDKTSSCIINADGSCKLTEAGTYTFKFKIKDNCGAVWNGTTNDQTEKTVTVKVKHKELTAPSGTVTTEYNGQTQSVNTLALPPSWYDSESYNDTDVIEMSGGEQINAGTYSVTIKLVSGGVLWSDSALNPSKERTFTFEITKATPNVTFSFSDETLNDKSELYLKDYTELPPIKNNHVSPTPGDIKWDSGQSPSKDLTVYRWTFTPTDTANYKSVSNTRTITFVDASATGITVYLKDNSEIYDRYDTNIYTSLESYLKTFITVKVKYEDGSESTSPIASSEYGITTADISVTAGNEQSKTIEVRIKDDATNTSITGFTGSVTATVKKALINSMRVAQVSGAVPLEYPVTLDEVKSNYNVYLTWNFSANRELKADIGKVSVALAEGETLKAGTVNFVFTYTDGNLTKTSDPISVSIAKGDYPNADKIVFEDKTVTLGGDCTMTAENVPEGVTVSYEGNDVTELGTYTVTAKFTHNNPNYKDIADKTATLTITDKKLYDKSELGITGDGVTVDGKTVTTVYTGEEIILSPTGTVKDADGNAVSDITAVVTIKKGDAEVSEIRDAGEYTVTVKYTGTDSEYESEFEIKYTVIVKGDYDLSGITFENAAFEYDKKEHSIEISGELPEGVSVSYEGNGVIEIGEYVICAKFTSENPNFNSIPDMTAMLTITKRKVTLTIDPLDSAAGEELLKPTATVTEGSILEGDTPYKLICGADKNTVGEYPVTWEYEEGFDKYYEITCEDGVYTVTKKADDPSGGGSIDMPVDINVEFKVIQTDTKKEYPQVYGYSGGYYAQLWYRNEDGTLGDEYTDEMNCILTLKVPTDIIDAICDGDETKEKIEEKLKLYFIDGDGDAVLIKNYTLARREDESWIVKFNYNGVFRAEVVFNAAGIFLEEPPAESSFPIWIPIAAGAALLLLFLILLIVLLSRRRANANGYDDDYDYEEDDEDDEEDYDDDY